jgi:trigger factor
MSKARPHIPLAVKREVRQKCGFGCVICGLPFFEYDHIEDYSKSQKHEAFGIALLCPNHHAQKTAGLLSSGDVWQARRSPCNLRGQGTGWELDFLNGSDCIVRLGRNSFTFTLNSERPEFVPVAIDGSAFLTFEFSGGDCQLSMYALDKVGNPLLEINRNVLTVGSATWDYDRVGRRLIVKTSANDTLLDLTFDPPHGITIRRARIHRNGVEIAVLSGAILLLNRFNGDDLDEPTVIKDCTFEGLKYGITVGDIPMSDGPTGMHFSNIARGVIASDPARKLKAKTVAVPGTQPLA